MAQSQRIIETGRLCCVCGRRESPTGKRSTAGFRTVLSRLGIMGDKAHPECVRAAGLKAAEKASLIAYYRRARAHQLATYARDNTWEDGVRTHQHTGGGAVYGHHAEAALWTARSDIHFLARLKKDLRK